MTQPVPKRPNLFEQAVALTVVAVLIGGIWMVISRDDGRPWEHFVIPAFGAICFWIYAGLTWLRERRRR
jgi:hypothetical protein